MAHPPTHSPHGTPKSDCHWVRERLERYWGFNLPGLDFYRTERHLGQCADCARAYQVIQQRLDAQAAGERGAEAHIPADAALANLTGWRYFDASGAQFQSNYLTDDEQERLADEILATLDGYDTILAGEAGSVAVAVCEPSERLGRRVKPRRDPWKRPLALAASLLLMVALPVLAVVGVQKFYDTSGSDEGSTAAMMQDSPQTVPSAPASLDTPGTASPIEPLLDSAPDDIDSTIGISLDTLTEKAEIQLELAALLPDTDEEYEAWARKEYPHIMGLYDILTEVDEKDPRSKPLWDGVPVNIPPWGQRLYAEVPEDERPAGWRALLIYSGEVFKFDWPTSICEANCKPTFHAQQRAAAIAGYEVADGIGEPYHTPKWLRAEIEDSKNQVIAFPSTVDELDCAISLQNITKDYDTVVTKNAAFARDRLAYLTSSIGLVNAPPFETIATQAQRLLGEFLESCIPGGNSCTRITSFRDFLERRGELLASLN